MKSLAFLGIAARLGDASTSASFDKPGTAVDRHAQLLDHCVGGLDRS
jgi:hypothetical protein